MSRVEWPSRREVALGVLASAGLFVTVFLIALLAGGPDPAPDESSAPVVAQAADEAPSDEIEFDAPSPEEKAAARSAFAAAKKKEQSAEIEAGPGGILPASAGDNGTRDTPSGRLGSISAQTMAGVDGTPAARSAFLLGRTAIAPPGAPYEVERAISAANAIVGLPYIWGGGHGSWVDRGYDCSGAVSYALGGAGLLGAPMDSTGLMDWGEPGPGKWITVYANAGHTYAVIAGLRWDTSGTQRGTGPKWYAEPSYPKGFVVRHPPGL